MSKSMLLSEIKKDCMRKMNDAMKKTYMDANEIIDISFDIYYSQGNPKYYSAGTGKRTYTLPNSKYLKMINGNNSAYLEAGYEGNYISYTTGTFTGGEVLGATMTGSYGVLGDSEYDNIAFEDIIKAAENNFRNELK